MQLHAKGFTLGNVSDWAHNAPRTEVSCPQFHQLPPAVKATRRGRIFFFFGNQFHYPLHREKARFGLKAAARPVSNSGEE
jgi:hypothetical protein